MERIDYVELIKDILTQHSINHSQTDTEIQLIFDDYNYHYQVLNIGWQDQTRIYGVIIHVDLKGDKIWIQRDATEIGIANQLLEKGVVKQDIVLGFQAPYKRQFTEFALG
ncbi:XisI protein [Cyanobacterium sp. Dongsha4]|uniref:XisI protein n=1 Tax=Cyanobacterium sp. DS4 TaxID=2878255 RepID=UPI002E80D37F|nr:XisI protein [Cyanobacterium sp. Dongsha4]WVL02274.1 XisI protein [Cyanobacterium sp. Dongsha4]